MATVRAFTGDGLQMWFPSGDHTPAHMHVRRPGEWTARIRLLDGEFIEIKPSGARIRGGDRRAVLAGIEQHREVLLAEWEACQRG